MGLKTERAVLIRYSVDGKGFVGSGLRVRDRYVLTAYHCALGTGHRVELVDGATYEASVHVRSDDMDVDLAVLEMERAAPPVEPLPPARVNQAAAFELTGAQALGFPKWKRGDSDTRLMVQLDGFVPTAEGLRPSGAGGKVPLLEFKGTGPAIRDHPAAAGPLEQASPWGGMSGAGVVVDDRVLGVIRSHNLAAGTMSLTVTALTAVADLSEPCAAKFASALGHTDLERWVMLPNELSALAGATLQGLDKDGRLPLAGQTNAGVFGVRKARTDIDLLGDPYYPYVQREVDSLVAAALDVRIKGCSRRLLLLVGEAMAGKSRAGAHALQSHPITQHLPLLMPSAGSSLERIADLTALLAADDHGQRAVLWLDDLDRYYPWLTEAMATRWRETPGLVVIATVRRDRLASLQDRSELRATWDFLNDCEQVEQLEIPAEWPEDDQANLMEAPGLVRKAVAAGTPLGEVLGSARELLLKLSTTHARVRALAEVVVDWHRTGITTPLPPGTARDLWPNYLPRREANYLAALHPQQVEHLFDEASVEACAPVSGTLAALVTSTGDGLQAEDFLINDRANRAEPIRTSVWEAALARALQTHHTTPQLLDPLGYNATMACQYEIARRAWTPLAQIGDMHAQYNLGVLLSVLLEPPELNEARRWYTAAAQKGHTDAQSNLGVLLTDLDPPELNEARRWYTASAQKGHTHAQCNLGLLLIGLDPPELEEARRWYTAAAEKGATAAQYNLGVLLAMLEPPELEEARRWYTAAAQEGHAKAQFNLGLLLANLEPPELDEARRWYTAAAQERHTKAQFNLGVLLANLDPPELDEARRWYTAAAQDGNTDAQYNLGVAFTDLNPPEFDEACRWFTKAAENGHTQAQFNLGVVLLTKLDPPEIDEAYRWLAAAAETGYTAAQYNLGLLHSHLDPPDLSEARRWYTKAAEAGHTQAQFRLGVLLATELDPPNAAEARYWYTTAAAAGDTNAQLGLGLLLAALLDPPELAEARRWLTTAARAGNTDAQFTLGHVLATLLDPPDLPEARYWYEAAARAGHNGALQVLQDLN